MADQKDSERRRIRRWLKDNVISVPFTQSTKLTGDLHWNAQKLARVARSFQKEVKDNDDKWPALRDDPIKLARFSQALADEPDHPKTIRDLVDALRNCLV